MDRNFVVEASAGAGKTSCLVDRMVALLAAGACEMAGLAAMTFTRKAAAELRERFLHALAQRSQEESDGPRRARLAKAWSARDRCFLGTIHAFCARLLRERPMEAGVAFPFVELEPDQDAELRNQAWNQTIAELHAANDPLLAELRERGLEPQELRAAFACFAACPEVDEWPGAAEAPPRLEPVAPALRNYLADMEALAARFPKQLPKSDDLQTAYRRLPRLARACGLERPRDVFRLLERFKPDPKVVKGSWPAEGALSARDVAAREAARWDAFCAQHAEPALAQWRAWRYGTVLRLFRRARRRHDADRAEKGRVTFQDLLFLAARLLRDDPAARRRLHERFTHLVVDEFQDTDPLQAEVMFLLAADDAEERDWRRVRPAPGSLFVVGDPQQSIYRFRRADIQTYQRAKQVLEAAGGEVLALTANFRATGRLVDWVNGVFGEQFPRAADGLSPAYRPMFSASRVPAADPTFWRLEVPQKRHENRMAEHEAEQVAAFVAAELRGDPARRPDDYLVLPLGLSRLRVIADALRRHGVPLQVAGGNQLGLVPALRDLLRLLEAMANPGDEVALVAVARGRLFGFSDPMLYRFREAGGRFSWASRVPDGLPAAEAERWRRLFAALADWDSAFRLSPPLAALQARLNDSCLAAQAQLAGDPGVAALALAKAVELLRAERDEIVTPRDLIVRLREFCEADPKDERLALPVGPRAAVRVMNLHKAKGLEADTVFLVDPGKEFVGEPDLHVEREGPTACGYLAVRGAAGRVIACPLKWPEIAAREQAFLDAEEIRKRYVAATRARRRLIVHQAVDENGQPGKKDFWTPLAERLADAPPLPTAEAGGATLGSGPLAVHAEAWPAELEACRRAVLQPTYRQVGVKAEALAGVSTLPAAMEGGAEWGTAVHFLLQSLLRQPDAELPALVDLLVAEQELPREWREPLAAAVAAVVGSDLWRRARASSECLSEVPIAVCRKADPGQPETLTLGQLDLAFREGDGWAIVDFKTDRQPEAMTATLVKQYRPQVEAYARLWEEATGQRVAERWLFFTHTGRLEPV